MEPFDLSWAGRTWRPIPAAPVARPSATDHTSVGRGDHYDSTAAWAMGAAPTTGATARAISATLRRESVDERIARIIAEETERERAELAAWHFYAARAALCAGQARHSLPPLCTTTPSIPVPRPTPQPLYRWGGSDGDSRSGSGTTSDRTASSRRQSGHSTGSSQAPRSAGSPHRDTEKRGPVKPKHVWGRRHGWIPEPRAQDSSGRNSRRPPRNTGRQATGPISHQGRLGKRTSGHEHGLPRRDPVATPRQRLDRRAKQRQTSSPPHRAQRQPSANRTRRATSPRRTHRPPTATTTRRTPSPRLTRRSSPPPEQHLPKRRRSEAARERRRLIRNKRHRTRPTPGPCDSPDGDNQQKTVRSVAVVPTSSTLNSGVTTTVLPPEREDTCPEREPPAMVDDLVADKATAPQELPSSTTPDGRTTPTPETVSAPRRFNRGGDIHCPSSGEE